MIIFFLLSLNCVSQTTSINNGSWTINANWSSSLYPQYNPTTNGDYIIISSMITLNSPFELKVGSTLEINCDTLTINGNVQFDNGAILIIHSCGVLKINGDVTNNNNSNQLTIDGSIIINGNFTGGNNSEVNGIGSMNITGTVTNNGGSVFGSIINCSVPNTCSSSNTFPLPIELISFYCERYKQYNLLEWVTATESYNKFFTLERSYDAVNFEQVVDINGANNSIKTIKYSFIDNEQYKGLLYYRLKQTDYNGNYSFSKIITLSETSLEKEINLINVTNLLGEETLEKTEGVKILYFDNGRVIKLINFNDN